MQNRSSSSTPVSPVASLLAGRLYVLVAAVLWSSGGFFAKHPSFDAWPPEQRGVLLAFWRALFAGLLILPAVRAPRWNFKLLPMGMCFAAMTATYLTAMSLTTAANAIWLQNTAPWWVFLIGSLVLGESVNRRDLTTLALGAAGVGLILFHEVQGASPVGVLFGLVSAVGYAGVIMLLRSLRREDTAWLVAFNQLFTAVVLAPFVLQGATLPSGWQWPLLMAFGLVQIAIPYTLFGRGLRSITSQEAAAIALVEPVLLPIWAWLVRGEIPAWWTLAGAGFILLGLMLRYARPQRMRKR